MAASTSRYPLLRYFALRRRRSQKYRLPFQTQRATASNQPVGGQKTLPEILVGTLGIDEAWARDYGSNSVGIYGKDEIPTMISTWAQAFDKLYLSPYFRSSSNPNLNGDDEKTIRIYIVGLLRQELKRMERTPEETSTAETPPEKGTKRKRASKH